VLVLRKATHGQQWSKGYTLIELQLPSPAATTSAGAAAAQLLPYVEAANGSSTAEAGAAVASGMQKLTAHDGRTCVVSSPPHLKLSPLFPSSPQTLSPLPLLTSNPLPSSHPHLKPSPLFPSSHPLADTTWTSALAGAAGTRNQAHSAAATTTTTTMILLARRHSLSWLPRRT
jgi:hypothetical protein